MPHSKILALAAAFCFILAVVGAGALPWTGLGLIALALVFVL